MASITYFKKQVWLVSYILGVALIGWHLGERSVDFNRVLGIAYRWQGLLGAFIGAATPVSFSLWQEKQKQKRKDRDLLVLLEKNLVMAINNLSGVDKMLHGFLKKNFTKCKDGILKDQAAGSYSVRQTFVPLSATFVFDKNLLSQSTGSNYLESLMLEVISMSQELPTLLQDINRQFDRTITLNAQIGLMKLNDVKNHNEAFEKNLEEFETFIKKQVFENNIPIYLRKLISARIALQARAKWGVEKWEKTFDHLTSMPIEEKTTKMDEYFKEEINKAITEIRGSFDSKLLLVGEESPLTQ